MLATVAAAVACLVAGSAAAAVQRVVIRTDDGVSLGATWYEPHDRPGPAVILVHMLQGTRRDWESLPQRLSAAGIGVLAFDLRGHGDSSGSGSDYAAMRADVKAARRYLAARSDVIPGRIGVAGASLGASVAALAAADEATAFASLALLSPVTDFRGVRIDGALRKLAARRMLVVASDEDSYAMRTARDIQKAAAGTRELLILSGAGHGTAMLWRSPDLAGSLVDWFRRTLL